MAPKKASPLDNTDFGAGDAELDQAIDDLRGVLKKDSDGDFGADFGSGSAETDLSAFGGDAGGLDSFGGDFAGSSDFGGGDFGGSDFPAAGGLDDAGSFGGGDFGGDTAMSSGSAGMTPAPGSGMTSNLDLIKDIPIDVQIVLGTSRMLVSGLMGLQEGATIGLDRKIGEPVEVMVNGRVIGRGEITVLEEDNSRFGVKLIEIKGTGRG